MLYNIVWINVTILFSPCPPLCVFLSVGCIAALSSAGEHIAMEMTSDLFKTLVEQDIAFYDSHKTGELVNRCVCMGMHACMHACVRGCVHACLHVVCVFVYLCCVCLHSTHQSMYV